MKAFNSIEKISEIGKISFFSREKGVEILGSIKHGDTLIIRLELNTQLLTHSAVINITNDENQKEMRMFFVLASRSQLYTTFCVDIVTDTLCRDNGLFFMSLEVSTEYGNFNLTRKNNGLLSLTREKQMIPLTVYSSEYEVPEKFLGGIMYHIFPDRFFASQKRIRKKDAVNVEEWDSPIPQYAEIAGGRVENNYFYGGNLYGIAEKAEYFESLGVNYIYLCPIFESRSNHKYDTGNYMKVDECFGGDKALKYLIDTMKSHGISVILDGVFNHTGDDSIYFNKKCTYESVGAYNSKESPYYSWFSFDEYPEKYRCWWGIEILPEVNTENKYFTEYICGKFGVIGKYVGMGIEGFRLDVVDELSDGFIEALRKRLKKGNTDAVLLGEVWEEAATKTAYGRRRKYFRGHQLDSVMNYPLREGIIRFLLKKDSEYLADICLTLQYNYPDFVFNSLMNFLSTHDTERILSVLCDDGISELTNSQLADYTASYDKLEKAKKLLKIGYVLLYTLPGVPSIYYGDEAGMQGGRDPFNRRSFPWGKEDKDLTEYVRKLGRLRRGDRRFSHGVFKIIESEDGIICYERACCGQRVVICVNMSDKEFPLYIGKRSYDLLNDCEHGSIINVAPENAVICE